MAGDAPLTGFRIGVTAARKADEQIGLLVRRGAEVVHAPALAPAIGADDQELVAATRRVLSRPVDVLVATTGVGMRAWLEAARGHDLLEDLLAHLGEAEVLARGPKSVGVLRRFGLREAWAPASEALDDVLRHLRARDLAGVRIVVQEHGQPLDATVEELRRAGADVDTVVAYRVEGMDSSQQREPLLDLVDRIAERRLHAVTFTAGPAVQALMRAAGGVGRADAVADAFGDGVVAACIGPVTAAAFEPWSVPTIEPERSRLAAMVHRLEAELLSRGQGEGVRATPAP